jgi:hypothetical protein
MPLSNEGGLCWEPLLFTTIVFKEQIAPVLRVHQAVVLQNGILIQPFSLLSGGFLKGNEALRRQRVVAKGIHGRNHISQVCYELIVFRQR